MSKGYLLVEIKVTDALAYEAYKQLAGPAVAQYGGRYLARGGSVDVLEGAWSRPERLVIVEFESVEQARKFYDSPEYRAAREVRQDAASMNMLVVEGF
jgi:uncharacterized protein (DUF1330 family)